MKKLEISDLKKDNSFIQVDFENSFIFFDKTGLITGLFSTPSNNEDIQININHLTKEILFSFKKQKDDSTISKQLKISHQKVWMGFSSQMKSDACISAFLENIKTISAELDIKKFTRIGYRTILYYEIENEQEEKELLEKYIKVKGISNFSLKLEVETKQDFKNTISLSLATNPSVSKKKLLLVDIDLYFDSPSDELESKLKQLSKYIYQANGGMLSLINNPSQDDK